MNDYLELDCPGLLQKVRIGTNPHCRCGGRVGFEFMGGMLPRGEAEKLFKMLYEQLKDITEPEEDEYNRVAGELRDYYAKLGAR